MCWIIIIIINCCAKGSGKEVKIHEFRYRDRANVEPDMNDCTSNNRSHWNNNVKLKEKFGNYTRKTFDRFTTKDSYTWNITHNTESTALWSLKPERWGSSLVREKQQEEKAFDKRHPYLLIIMNNILFIFWLSVTQQRGLLLLTQSVLQFISLILIIVIIICTKVFNLSSPISVVLHFLALPLVLFPFVHYPTYIFFMKNCVNYSNLQCCHSRFVPHLYSPI